MRAITAFIRYIANDGSGARSAAPGRASVWATIWMISSEPFPIMRPCSSPMPNVERSRAASSGAAGSG